jgi:hypothetical protein
MEAGYGFESADEDAAGEVVGFAGDVHAEVAAVDGVDVGVPGGAEEDLIAGSGAAMGVGGRVGRGAVGAEVGFGLDDAACHFAVDEKLAEEAWSDLIWR